MAGVRQVKAGWYNAFRPWTLHGAIVPVLLGGAMAYGAGSEEWILFILALAGGVLLQSAANLLNTYGDYRAGLDTVENHSRAPELVSGTLRPKDVKIAGLACLAVTALIGLYMVWATGWGIAVFGIAGIAGAGLYTVWVSYKYMGLGQASVFVMMGLLMPMGTFYLMTGALSWDVLFASLPNALMITAVLGGKIQVPGIDDTLELTVPAGTASGTRFCIRGKGVRTVNGTGNLYVDVQIDIPEKLSREQAKKLSDFEDSIPLKSCDNMQRYANNVSALYGRNIEKQ